VVGFVVVAGGGPAPVGFVWGGGGRCSLFAYLFTVVGYPVRRIALSVAVQ